MNVFIEKSRNMILKEVRLRQALAFAKPSWIQTGVPRRWEAFYYVDGKPRDLIADMRAAAGWLRSAIVVNRTACAGHQYGGRQCHRLSGRHLGDTRSS